MNLGQNTFSNPFNIFDFLPSQRSLEMAKAESDAAAISESQQQNALKSGVFNALTGLGVNPTVASMSGTGIDFAPLLGEISAGLDAKMAMDRGNLGEAGLLAASSVLPVVPPVVGKKIKSLTKEQIDPLGYGAVKGQQTVPLNELDIGYVDNAVMKPFKPLTIEDLQGSVLYPLLGDQSMAGRELVSIGGNVFNRPVNLEGGFNFMRRGGDRLRGANSPSSEIWASAEGVTTRIDNEVKKIAEETGLPVNLVYSAMGKNSVDFATFPAETLVEMMPFSKILKKDMNEFVRRMRSDIKIGSDSYEGIKDFPKLDAENLREYLSKADPEVRKKFVRLMDNATFQNAGFPSVAQARYATTEEVLKNVRAGESGSGIAQLDLSAMPDSNPLYPHGTYSSQLYGNYIGGLLDTVPRNILWRDFFKGLENQRTKSGKLLNPAMKDYSFRLNLPTQIVDQQLVDTIMNLRQ